MTAATPNLSPAVVQRALVFGVFATLVVTASAGDDAVTRATPSLKRGDARVVTLRNDPRLILRAVAMRMGVTLRPEIPVPKVLLESETPLSRLQAVSERQWGFRPRAFVSMYASTTNEIYLVDDAAAYGKRGGTLDDVLAHEYTHYLQETYLKTMRRAEWSEFEAVSVQTWFRAQQAARRLIAADVPSTR